MIRIGHTWVDMNAVSAICENRSESGYSMFLNSGRIIGLPDVTEDEVVRVLEACGLIEGDAPAVDMAVFTVDELAELKEAFRTGLRWVAQDSDGKTFAYRRKPDKSSRSWADEVDTIYRLKAGDYDALSFEDPEPIDLMDVLGVRCDEDDESDQ